MLAHVLRTLKSLQESVVLEQGKEPCVGLMFTQIFWTLFLSGALKGTIHGSSQKRSAVA